MVNAEFDMVVCGRSINRLLERWHEMEGSGGRWSEMEGDGEMRRDVERGGGRRREVNMERTS